MMATTNPIPESTPTPVQNGADLLVMVAPVPPEQLEGILASLTASFAPEGLLVATSDSSAAESHPGLRIISATAANGAWTLTAADFVQAYQLALSDLATAAQAPEVDLAVAHYELSPRAGLVNSAILYPLTRALFAQRARFPLAIDLGLSLRMAERLAAAGQRFTALNQGGALIWPVNEAAAAGFVVDEVDVGTRVVPQPPDPDLSAILPLIAGSLFGDLDAKAAAWQRARTLPPGRTSISQVGSPVSARTPADNAANVASMLDAFRLAYVNLREIWSLVLPPNTLLGLKRLSVTDAATFRMPDSLWARIVYDFLLAYRLRTINRGHLLGALIPLYLAWVAGHVNITASGVGSDSHLEAVAAAFEAEKPYLVARWRWPDRFNP
jgi:hypothetical protein